MIRCRVEFEEATGAVLAIVDLSFHDTPRKGDTLWMGDLDPNAGHYKIIQVTWHQPLSGFSEEGHKEPDVTLRVRS